MFMKRMNDIDPLALDGRTLRLFLTVLDTGSVTLAAERLDMTQSAVSHALKRLGTLVEAPLFVKSGRGIAPTARALALEGRARALLDGLANFGAPDGFEPGQTRLSLTVAANDLQRDLLLPPLMAELERLTPQPSLRVVPSLAPTPEMLREGRCDLLISPLPPAGLDIVQRKLLSDRYVCFYDASVRAAPDSREDYLAARHVGVLYPDGERLDFDKRLQAAGIVRDVAVQVPGFSAVPAFVRGTARLATMPSLFRTQLMRDLAATRVPVDALGLREAGTLTMFMAWHRRFDDDPRHLWLRRLVIETASALAARRGTG